MPEAYMSAALSARKLHSNRPTSPFPAMSNKFALSDMKMICVETWSSAHVSSLDSPEIGPLVELVRISLVDKALTQTLGS
tara:strand:- start:172 stop:411 length:240 start_codon:yes stop_codon:yes gene_type:complete